MSTLEKLKDLNLSENLILEIGKRSHVKLEKDLLWRVPACSSHCLWLCFSMNRDTEARMQRGQSPSYPPKVGKGANVPFLCCLLTEFFCIFFLHSFFSQA